MSGRLGQHARRAGSQQRAVGEACARQARGGRVPARPQGCLQGGGVRLGQHIASLHQGLGQREGLKQQPLHILRRGVVHQARSIQGRHRVQGLPTHLHDGGRGGQGDI